MKKQVLQPTYFEKFSCIGPACEDTCCAGWKLSVDKRTFQMYRKVTSGSIAKDLRTNVTRERANPSDSNYAKIKVDEHMNCSFLNEDKLCNIFIELGENFLCDTCTFFPRQISAIEQRVERDLSVACPEAARLILLNPDGIDFVMMEDEFAKHTLFAYPDVTSRFWDMRIFVIQILQNRQASIESRLLVLGIFMRKMQTTEESDWEQRLPLYISECNDILNRAASFGIHKYLPSDEEMINIIYRLLEFQKEYELFNRRFDECIAQLEEGLQLNGGDTVEQSVALYKQSVQNYYKPFFEEKDYILENYLVNYVFKNSLPQSQMSFVKEYEQLFMWFLFIKGTLIGLGSYHQGLSEEIVLKFIQSFTKTLENNKDFRKLMKSILEREND
ncbi:flagellin lysine-N-methylase [Lysinibacillus capsici]|uniref:Flagellin lysine-N-methylase n=1 Tax=Lysinibacillus capsici TaxID=2115968 RepID=A0ABY8KDR4_9BACI|nr:flagellin lysine-N-methylase [Lysinibacillus capsici]MCR6523193.1 flagellin lysine-N-methylase [Lysinibacillus capsici]MDP1393431.1 flagellin lysine-N-methylase [Lysinibacillus capsici]MDP1413905.1 flagellin lysine-N-methylase [Lysinibacillus capsici]MDP1429157.1 flagellin lysine-N-methylase [Lysinibacillus capsici]WGF37660.1 flagellin lysine-N-methylase [Lysinibacillus capsici]